MSECGRCGHDGGHHYTMTVPPGIDAWFCRDCNCGAFVPALTEIAALKAEVAQAWACHASEQELRLAAEAEVAELVATEAKRWQEILNLRGEVSSLKSMTAGERSVNLELSRRAAAAEAEVARLTADLNVAESRKSQAFQDLQARGERLELALRWFMPALEAQFDQMGPARDSYEGREYGTQLIRARAALEK